MMLNPDFSNPLTPWDEADIPAITAFVLSQGSPVRVGAADAAERVMSVLKAALAPDSPRIVVILRDEAGELEGVAICEGYNANKNFDVTDLVFRPDRIQVEVEGRLMDAIEEAALRRCNFPRGSGATNGTVALLTAKRNLFSKDGYKQLRARDFISGRGSLSKLIFW